MRSWHFFERLGVLRVQYCMNKKHSPSRKHCKARHSLGELVAALGSCTRDSREVTAALLDLFKTGRVLLCDDRRFKRVRVGV